MSTSGFGHCRTNHIAATAPVSCLNNGGTEHGPLRLNVPRLPRDRVKALPEFSSATSINKLATQVNRLCGIRLQLLLNSHLLSDNTCKTKKEGARPPGGGAQEADEIRPGCLKALDVVGLSWFTRLCNIAKTSGAVPLDWQTGMVVPIFKSGDQRVCSNYRGMTLLGLPGKVYARVLEKRIRSIVEPLIEE
ncbi:hypothetical protein D4764_06G0014160 [Takifugu flavidus]|uniref:Reverse transcriptase domain-containing protein n=1 Tax=Takifugu flavidus TaxID=433684 RepID=A0A5C6MXW4_9TELE|nr:hypothetical protein D4764_06G0014160 [Takifugu flavidus]